MLRTCVANGQVPLPTPSLATRGAAANLGTVVARRQSASSSGQALPTCDLVSRLEAPGRARSTRNLLNRARTRHDIACPPGAPRGMTPGRPGGQLATHAAHAPVTGGVGHAFAKRRPGVRIPAAPPPENPAPPAQTLKSGRGFVIVVCPSCASVPPAPVPLRLPNRGLATPWVE